MIIALARSKDSMASRSSMPRPRACVIVSKLEVFNPLSGFRYRETRRLIRIYAFTAYLVVNRKIQENYFISRNLSEVLEIVDGVGEG